MRTRRQPSVVHLENAGLVRAWLDSPGQVPRTKRFETLSEGDATCPGGGGACVCVGGSGEGQGGHKATERVLLKAQAGLQEAKLGYKEL